MPHKPLKNIKMIQDTPQNTLTPHSKGMPPQLKKAQKKSQATKATRLTSKQKSFAREFVKSENGVQSALKVYDTKSYNTAGMIASENLQKPKIRVEILSLMQQNNIELSEVLSIHKRNLNQDINLPVSQKAVADFYDILGMKDTQHTDTSVKVAFIINK